MWLIIEKGIFKGEYQTTREQASWVAPLTGTKHSHGCSYADSWDSVQFQRMPNVSLLPAEKDISLNDIVSATDRGIMIRNRGSWSIDHQRYNFSFSGQAFYEVKGGKVVGMLKDVAYQAVTPVFLDLDGHDRRQIELIGWVAPSPTEKANRSSSTRSVTAARPRAIPRREHHQHGEKRLMTSAPKSLFPGNLGILLPLARRSEDAHRSHTRLLQNRRNTREHSQRLVRQYPLRRWAGHDIGRHVEHHSQHSVHHRQETRVGNDQRSR